MIIDRTKVEYLNRQPHITHGAVKNHPRYRQYVDMLAASAKGAVAK